MIYTFTVHNGGPSSSTGSTLSDPLPAGTTFDPVPSDAGCSLASGVVTCAVGPLASGSGAAVIVALAADESLGNGTLHNVGVVAGYEGDPNAVNNSSGTDTTVTPVSDLAVHV